MIDIEQISKQFNPEISLLVLVFHFYLIKVTTPLYVFGSSPRNW